MAHLRSLPVASLQWHEALSWQDTRLLQQLIQARFAQQHNATIHHFLPRLFGLWQAGEPLAAVGIRVANSEPLFLERYLDGQAEQELNKRFDPLINRQSIAEIGNLASLRPGLQRQLFVYLAHQLVAEGITWLLFTATPEVANGLRRLGLEPQPITPADPDRLGDEAHLWGHYYAQRPWVMAGDLRNAMRTLKTPPISCHPATEEVLHARLA